jgi:tetratricopeptide (TPR) repeat protein
LSYDYSFNAVPIVGLGSAQLWLTLALLMGLGVVLVRGAKTRSPEAFGVLFLFLSWATSANVFFLVGTTFGERLLYAPLLGVMLALASAAQRYLPRLHPRAFTAASVVILASFAAASAMRIPTWKDDWTLYTTGPTTQPGSARVQYNAGTAYLRMRALASPPSADRGAALAQAASHLQEAVRIDPIDADALLNLAVTRYQLGQYPDALELGRAAYTRAPQLGAAHAVAGSALFRMQRFSESVQENRAALAQGYIADDTWNFVGAALLQTGDYAGAVDAFTRASERVPQDQEIRRNLETARRALAQPSSH